MTNSEWLNSAASLATLLVVSVTAFAALRQIRHMRSGNQTSALLQLVREYQSPEVAASYKYILTDLETDAEESAHREALTKHLSGPIQRAELFCNFMETTGSLVASGALDLNLVLSLFDVETCWRKAQPFVILVRRPPRGPEAYEMFECLAMIARQHVARRGGSQYLRGIPHDVIEDKWLAADQKLTT